MKQFFFLFICCCFYLNNCFAQEPLDSIPRDSSFIKAVNETSLSKFRKKELIKAYLKGKIEDLNDIDTTWISPNYYNFTFMIQNTNTFESFSVASTSNATINRIDFSPAPTLRLGAYFGWRWLFLGYTFNVNDILGKKRNNEKKNTEVDLSIYTSKIGIDLYYRKTGNNFKIQEPEKYASDGNTIDDDFSGLNIKMKGINVYYIFNHRFFSFPAAYSQSTVQRRSCGSFKLGFSYSQHKVSFDYTLLPVAIQEKMSEAMKFDRVYYSDYNISFGYAYNWVFKYNWLLDVSLTPAIAYTRSHLESDGNFNLFKDLRFKNLNFDLITRIALVYNNTKYFAGLSFIYHSFNYKKEQFSINNSFGSLNFYVGLNFKKKKEYSNY